MDIPTRFYRNVLTSFAHHDLTKYVGAYRPHPDLPVGFVGKENNRKFVIPVGKICAAVPIDRSTGLTVGGGKREDKFYASGEGSGISRGPAGVDDAITEANGAFGAGSTILGDIYPLPGLYTPIEVTDPSEAYTFDDAPEYIAHHQGYDMEERSFNAYTGIPVGVVTVPVEKWRRLQFLNNTVTPTYNLVRQNRMVLPYLNMKALIAKLDSVDGIGWEGAEVPDTDEFLRYIHGNWKYITADPANMPPTHLSERYQDLVQVIHWISQWYTFYWDTFDSNDEVNIRRNFHNGVKPDIFGNYTASTILCPANTYTGLNITQDSDGDYYCMGHIIDNLTVGKVLYRDHNMPKDFLQYVDAPPGAGLGTDAGGIAPIVYDFAHDFILLLNTISAFSAPTNPDPMTLKAEDIVKYVKEDKIFGSADIFVEV